ncbi:MAG: tetratricopeptide repeat protein [Candidatus Tectimicrobiota bacterium]
MLGNLAVPAIPGAAPSAWELACAAHQQGDLARATYLYRHIPRQSPRHVDALYRLGGIAYQQQRYAVAQVYLRQAASLQPTAAAVWCLLGDSARAAGDLPAAIAHYSRTVELLPQSDEAYTRLGDALQVQGQLEAAIPCYRQALRLNPAATNALTNLGVALQEQGDLAAASDCFQAALRLEPASPETCVNLAVLWNTQGRLAEAEACLQGVIQRLPTMAVAHNNLGLTHQAQGRLELALQDYTQALTLRPGYAKAHNNLGTALHRLGRLDEAVQHLQQALHHQHDFVEAYNNLGLVLQAQGHVEEALAAFAQAIQRKPAFVQAHWNRSLALLLQGDFQAGWAEYEWRWKRPESPPPAYAQPRWDGSPFPHQTLLLYAEQGLGDTLQCARYLPLVAARGGQVIVACPATLVPLLRTCPGGAQIMVQEPEEIRRQPFDLHLPLLSLPGIFETTLASIPNTVPYLHPDPERLHYWRQRFTPEPACRVGLVWGGNPQHLNDHNRSGKLAMFAPLGGLPGLRLYSLQTGSAAAQIDTAGATLALEDLGRALRDFADTAAVIAHLDLVITVDTAVAHLAGALGKPVWTLIPYAPDWRWGRTGTQTPWYPSMRLFRQSTPGDWASVVSQLTQALAAHLAQTAAAGEH